MRIRAVSAIMALCMVSVLALSSSASAEERAIQSGDSYMIEADLDFMEFFTYSWTCDVVLDFTIEDPAGNTYLAVTDVDTYMGIIPATTAGTYTITWTNSGLLLAHLSFDVSGTFNEAEDAISALTWVLVIAGIVLVAVVVIVVIVVVMGGKKAPAQPAMGPQPQLAAQALATGHCPTCGNQIDPNAAFCPKCGTRYR